jgi:predicted transposase YdaD
MPKPYDVTMRDLFQLEPAAWLEFLGIPVPDPGAVQVIDSNLATVTAEADRLVRIGGKEPRILHVEFLSGRDLAYPEQAHWYHTLVRHRHRLPVWTVLVLLRPAADGPELNGTYQTTFPGRGRNLSFCYDVVRVWLEPPERLLTAGLTVLPLAPVSNVPPARLSEVLRTVAERLRNEADPELKTTLWSATLILLGLDHPKEEVYRLTKEITTMVLGIRGLEASSIYQDIFSKGEAAGEAKGRAQGRAEGRTEEDRALLLSLGRDKFGPPDEQLEARIAAIVDQALLQGLLHAMLRVSTWEELMATVPS